MRPFSNGLVFYCLLCCFFFCLIPIFTLLFFLLLFFISFCHALTRFLCLYFFLNIFFKQQNSLFIKIPRSCDLYANHLLRMFSFLCRQEKNCLSSLRLKRAFIWIGNAGSFSLFAILLARELKSEFHLSREYYCNRKKVQNSLVNMIFRFNFL